MGQTLLSFEPALVVLSRAQAAIAAAQAGDWTPANAMELDFLNDPANEIHPGCMGATPEVYAHAKAYDIERHDDGLHVMWVASEEPGEELHRCQHEAVKGVQRLCDACEGAGWKARSPLVFVETDIDGRIITEDCEI